MRPLATLLLFLSSLVVYSQNSLNDEDVCIYQGQYFPCDCTSPSVICLSNTTQNIPTVTPNASTIWPADRRVVKFKVKFNANCNYNLHNSHQDSWNKVMKIAPFGAEANRFINRLGWRYDTLNNDIQVAHLLHVNHEDGVYNGRVWFPMQHFPLESFINAELFFSPEYMITTVEDVSVIYKDDLYPSGFFDFTAITKKAYFGGQLPAPQDISIRLEDIVVESNPTLNSTSFHDSKYKHFFYCNFFDGDLKIYYAEDEVIASINNPDSRPANSRFVLEPNSNVSLVSQNVIKLENGFHAKSGSDFHAYLGNVVVNLPLFNARHSQDSTLMDTTLNAMSDESTVFSKTEHLNLENTNNDIQVFPNPTTSTVSVNSDLPKELRNSLGQIIIETKEREIDLQHLSVGIYYLKVGEEVFKVIKE